MRPTLFLCLIAFSACKKHDSLEQSAPPPPSGASVAATAPSATLEPIASIAPSASASAAAHEHAASDIEAEKEAARREALREAAQFGMIGSLRSGGADAGSPWGREESFGTGGLGLTGVGEPAGRGEGIGLGNIGTIGHPASDAGRPPQIRQGAIQVSGRLPPEVIQRITRQNFGRFRACYQAGLRSNPSLQGRVAVKYTIDRDGSVKGTPTDGGSDLPDQSVVQCVIRALQNLSYPQPEGGIVTVVYPLIFTPGS